MVLEGKRIVYVNVLKEITKYCDCERDPGPIVCKDIGILVSEDVVAVDRASLDLINKTLGRNLFKEENGIDPYLQVKEAAKLGMGSWNYTLITL